MAVAFLVELCRNQYTHKLAIYFSTFLVWFYIRYILCRTQFHLFLKDISSVLRLWYGGVSRRRSGNVQRIVVRRRFMWCIARVGYIGISWYRVVPSGCEGLVGSADEWHEIIIASRYQRTIFEAYPLARRSFRYEEERGKSYSGEGASNDKEISTRY